jgi:signal transduction histidine kinase
VQSFSELIGGRAPSPCELRVLHKNGKNVILNCTSVPMIIENQMVGVIGYGRDITEMRGTEEQLRKTEKLSVVGELAASIAHEIRNPLTSIKGFIQLLKQESKSDQHYHEIILTELERINQIVSELLVLAKPQEIVFHKANINQILKDVKGLLESQAHFHGVEMIVDALPDMPMMDCDSNQLKQVFINVIKNAIEASGNGGTVKIRVNKSAGMSILISIEDNGCGIPEERLKRLGEPFHSYKEKGTGLGLTVCYRIIEAHGGKIKFNSQVEKGTTVEIIIPLNQHKKTAQ